MSSSLIEPRPGATLVSRASLLGFLLAVPLASFAIAKGRQALTTAELRGGLEQHSSLAWEAIDAITLEQWCSDPGHADEQACGTDSDARALSVTALGAAAVGLGLMLAIRLAGTAARNNRSLLASLFTPGLYAALLVLSGLVLAHAVLVILALTLLIGGAPPCAIVASILIGAVVGVIAMALGAFSAVRAVRTGVIGDALSAAECPALWKRVEETATKLGALAPEHIVIGLDPNFFVTEAAVICSSGELTGRTLYCSLPLCRILSASELTSILGHELSHFSGLDTRFSKRFYPVYRGTASSMAMLGEAADERGPASIALLPAIAILGYFLECFSLAESRFSRERELAADVAAAGVTSPVTAAAALVKVHAFSGLWQALHEAAVAAVREGGTLANLSKTYFQAAAENAQPSVLDGIVDTHLAHPTDSHPSLAVRLNALEIDIGDVTADALNVTPSDPAIALVAGAEAREEAITAAYQRLLAQALELESAAEPQTRTVGAA